MKSLAIFLALVAFTVGCSPTIQVAAPKEPIEINLNVKIQHDIRVRVDDELEDMFDDDSDLF